MTLNKLYIKQSSMKLSGQWIYLDPAIDLASIRLYSLLIQLSDDKSWNLIDELMLLLKVYQADDFNILVDRLFLFRYISVKYKNKDIFIIIYQKQLSINQMINCNYYYAKLVCDYPNSHFNDQLYANQIAEEVKYFDSITNGNKVLGVESVINDNKISGVDSVNTVNKILDVDSVNSVNKILDVDSVNTVNKISGVDSVNTVNKISGVDSVINDNSHSMDNCTTQLRKNKLFNNNELTANSSLNQKIVLDNKFNTVEHNYTTTVKDTSKFSSGSSCFNINTTTTEPLLAPKNNDAVNNVIADSVPLHTDHSPKLAPSKITQYTTKQLDWTDVPSNRGDHHYFYNAFRAEHLNLEQAQNILNVIAHKHRANESIKHLPAFLRTLITTAKNGTLYPVWVKKDRGHSAPGKGSKTDGVRSQRELMREHHINYAAFIDQGQNELAQNYLIEHALIFKDGRIVCHE